MNNNSALEHVKKSTHKETRASMFFMFSVLIIGSLLFLFNKFLCESYSWLFISPSYSGTDELTWINSSWGVVLAIHGTIAALSIAFMGMFIQQVAEASNKDFVYITRQLVLRQYKFYQFSVDGICSLLIGIFFLVIGGGVIQYGISMSCSIYFILRYMMVFKYLYFITEKKEIIDSILLNKMKVVSEYVYDINEKSKNLRNAYEACIGKYSSLTISIRMDFDLYKEVKLSDPYFASGKVITGFNELELKKLDSYILREYAGKNVELYLQPSFYDSGFIKDAYVFHAKDDSFDSFDSLVPLIQRCFNTSDISEEVYFYSEMESNVIQSTITSLLSNNSKQLDFCIETLYLIIISSQEITVFHNLTRAMRESPSAKNTPRTILRIFYEELIWKFYFDGRGYDVDIFKDMLSLPRFIYDSDDYLDFIEMSQDFIEQKVSHTQNDKFLYVYLKDSIRNLVYRQYNVFNINTSFLTSDFYSPRLMSDSKLEEGQVALLDATKTIIAYLSVRLEYIKSQGNTSLVELKNDVTEVGYISSLLCDWLNPKYLESIYYSSETYDVLFSKNSMFLDSSDEFELREIRGGKAIAINVGYHRAVSLALMLFKSFSFNNSLSIIYIDDLQEFVKRNDFTTHFIDKVIDVIGSDYFMELVELIEIDDAKKDLEDYQSRKEDLLATFEQLRSKKNQVVMMKVESLPYSHSLIVKYEDSLKSDFIKSVQEYIDLSLLKDAQVLSGLNYEFQIRKREILEPINGEFFSQSSSIYASHMMRNLIDGMVKSVEKARVSVVKINHPNDLPEGVKYITINSLIEEIEYSFRFYRGLRYTNSSQSEPFDDNGFYYIALSSCYDFYGDKANILSVNFDSENNGRLNNKNDDNDNVEPEVRMSVSLLLRWEPKELQKVFFISAEDCKRHLANQRSNN